MRIELHHEFADSGELVGTHVVHTEKVDWNYVIDPKDGVTKIHVIDFLAQCAKDEQLCARAGWKRISNHPKHAGKTHLQIVHDEVTAARDVEACNALGIYLPKENDNARGTE